MEPSQAWDDDTDQERYGTFLLKCGLLRRGYVKTLHWDVTDFHLESSIENVMMFEEQS